MWDKDVHPYRETGRVLPIIVIWVLIALALGMLATTITLGYQKFYTNRQTDIIRQTNQYQTSTQEHLIVLLSAYTDLDTKIAAAGNDPSNAALVQGYQGQQKAILLEMRQQAATMDSGQVPPDVRTFLLTH